MQLYYKPHKITNIARNHGAFSVCSVYHWLCTALLREITFQRTRDDGKIEHEYSTCNLIYGHFIVSSYNIERN